MSKKILFSVVLCSLALNQCSDNNNNLITAQNKVTKEESVTVNPIPQKSFSPVCDQNIAVDSEGNKQLVLSMTADPSANIQTATITNNNVPGFYKVYIPNWGLTTQAWNQSFYLSITNAINPEGTPTDGSCLGNFIVTDIEDPLNQNFPVYAGRFWLTTGENELTVHHFCKLYMDNIDANPNGFCEEFHTVNQWGGCPACDADIINIATADICIEENEPQ